MGMCICSEYGEGDIKLRYGVYTLRRRRRNATRFEYMTTPMRSTERRENDPKERKAKICTAMDEKENFARKMIWNTLDVYPETHDLR